MLSSISSHRNRERGGKLYIKISLKSSVDGAGDFAELRCLGGVVRHKANKIHMNLAQPQCSIL